MKKARLFFCFHLLLPRLAYEHTHDANECNENGKSDGKSFDLASFNILLLLIFIMKIISFFLLSCC